MANQVQSNIVVHAFGRVSQWLGRSGRAYHFISENFERFALNDGDLHIVAKGSHVLWVGSTDELVADPMSRTRFRLALDCADRVFRMATPAPAADRMNTIWDLEGAEQVMEAQAA
jgi:hypothetical protein